MNKSNSLHKVVLIDDQDTYYNIIKPKCEKYGAILKWAKNGNEGIEMAMKYNPSLVVTDIVMPEFNGFDVIKRLKSDPKTKDISFIILSDWGEPRLVYDKEFLDSLGIVKYLIKSNYTPTEVFREIKIYLDQ